MRPKKYEKAWKNTCGWHMHWLLFHNDLWWNAQYFAFKAYSKILFQLLTFVIPGACFFLKKSHKKGKIFVHFAWTWNGNTECLCVCCSQQPDTFSSASFRDVANLSGFASLHCKDICSTSWKAPFEYLVFASFLRMPRHSTVKKQKMELGRPVNIAQQRRKGAHSLPHREENVCVGGCARDDILDSCS